LQAVVAPDALDRCGGRPCVTVTANPRKGGDVAETAARCRGAAEAARRALGLSNDYRLVD
jgi:hypothetical protein